MELDAISIIQIWVILVTKWHISAGGLIASPLKPCPRFMYIQSRPPNPAPGWVNPTPEKVFPVIFRGTFNPAEYRHAS